MKIRDEIFNHPDWWQTKFPITDFNETHEEFKNRVAYLNYIEPNTKAMQDAYYEEAKLDYETIDEYHYEDDTFFSQLIWELTKKHKMVIISTKKI